jgi:hypothetical protein
MIAQKMQQLHAIPWSGENFRPFTEAQLKEVESEINGRLPPSYREMLKTVGGVFFASEVYYHDPQAKMPVMFGGFYEFNELLKAIRSHEEVLPDGIIPIGDDGGGNLYCLGVKGDDFSKVFFHDHGVGWDEEAQDYLVRGETLPLRLRYQTVYLLANSFDEFVNSMWCEDA